MPTTPDRRDQPTDVRFAVPAVPASHVDRPRLVGLLDEAAALPLTLIGAPAGSGKTALAAAWSARRTTSGRLGWITFEDGDQGASAFWPLVGAGLSATGVQLPDPPRGGYATHRAMLTAICAALTKAPEQVTLVLDGLEVADPALGDDIAWVLRHTGHRLRLVILTRVDPLLPLHRFRLDDAMAELRAADLAFTDGEAARLVATSGSTLRPESVTRLVSVTRGWAVGLRFAALHLAAAEDPDRAVDGLAGDSGNIAEYLMSEVLQTLPSVDRELLLRTSVVDVLRPGLCELLGGRGAGRRLAQLAHANVLVEAVTGQPGWHRYHPFLKDLLRAEVSFASPRLTRRLGRQAARWYADEGMLGEAVTHAATSGWWADAAAYAVDGLAVAELIVGDDSTGVVRALRELPHDVSGPHAAVTRAALALSRRDLGECDRELARVRGARERSKAEVDPGLDLAVAAVVTGRTCAGDDADAIASAHRLIDQLAAHPQHDVRGHRVLTALGHVSLGVAQLRAGDINAAGDTLVSAAAEAEDAPCTPLRVIALAQLAMAAALEGRLTRARDLASRSVALADEASLAPWARPPLAEVALAWVGAERYDVGASQQHLDAALRWNGGDSLATGLSAVVRTRLLRTLGDVTHAEAVAQEKAAALGDGLPWLSDLLRREAAESAIDQDQPDRALEILAGLTQPDARATVLVRGYAQLRCADRDRLDGTLERLNRPDGSGGVTERVDVLVLQSAHALRRGEGHRARTALRKALELAAPEARRRPFRDAPATVREALVSDPALLEQHAWLGMEAPPHASERSGWWPGQEAGPEALHGQVIEPLTPKEQQVLGLLAELLTTEEIASTMFVSVNTVRTHIRSILRKLAVSRRNDAVRRARALSLITG